LIPISPEEFSAIPDVRKHDRHSTLPRLNDVKRTGSLIVRRGLEDWLTAGVVAVSSILLLKSLGWNNWLRSFDEGGLESVYRHLNESSAGVYSEVFGLLFSHFKRSIVRRELPVSAL